jgi:Flagellar assembly protein FliH
MLDIACDTPLIWYAAPSSPRPSPPPSLPSWMAPRRASEPPVRPPAEAQPATPPEPAPIAAQPEPQPSPEESDSEARRMLLPPPAPDTVERLQAEVDGLRRSLAELAAETGRARREALEASEKDLVALATAIAEQILGRELSSHPEILGQWVRQGLSALSERDEVTVAIGTDLAALMTTEAWAGHLDELGPPIVDPTLPPFRCEVRTRYGRADAGLGPRLAAMVEALGTSDGGAG